MAASAYASAAHLFGNGMPKVWKPAIHPSLFGNLIVVAFLLAQGLDGIFTYVGVTLHGPMAEGNPLIGTLIAHYGEGAALIAAKLLAAGFGIALHLAGVHRVVAVLTGFYVAAAVVPWTVVLFF